MSIIEKALANIQNIKTQIPIWANDSILENKDDILNLLKFGQLGIGKNSHGKPLKWSHRGQKGNGYYAPATQDIANNSFSYSGDYTKTVGDPYNFFWTGNTFQFMDLKMLKNNEYSIFTTGGKQQLLESIYGEIFDLTKENNFYVNKTIIEPYLAQKIEENMFNF